MVKKTLKEGVKMVKIRNKLVFLLLLIMLSSVVYGANEIVQHADRLNYWNSETHTVTVTNTGTASTQVNITVPTGFTYNSGTCSQSGGIITCDLGPSASKNYLVDSSSSSAEYTLSIFSPTTNNSYTGNSVKFLRIKDDELFHTLVEYGRGRGNYFFDTFGSAHAGSGHTGVGCPYVPNGTMFELNFLHKINNVKQYFGNLSAEAYNATFSCAYPNKTVVREHLITAIVTNSTGTFTSYKISKIEGSWERMGYLGMDFDVGDYSVGNNIPINCTNIAYYFPEAGGNFVVNEDSFTLQVRNPKPFIAAASTTDTIGNGTQEVLITYNITNNEVYTVDDVVIEINAPPYADFIGTRGELWGTALDQYRIEKSELSPGESELITLVARFDTSNAPSMSSVNLTKGIKLKYVTCWELNAYNPTEYGQNLVNIGTGAVNMVTPTTIVNIRDRLNLILNITTRVNDTIVNINNTVSDIQSIVQIINNTTQDTNTIVKQINNTANTILNQTQIIVSNTNIILNDTSFIADQLNCNGTVDSPLCDKISIINQSLQTLWNLSLYINYTANNLNITVIENINTSGVNVTVNVDLTNLTNYLHDVKELINCTGNYSDSSVCRRVERIENLTSVINNSVVYLQNMTTYFNATVFGNYTFQDILNKINNTSVDTSDVLSALRELREFDEETVFLITDSFNLQQKAKDDFNKGDIVSAVNNLREANTKLKQATDKLMVEKDKLTTKEEGSFSTGWVWGSLFLILGAGILIFYFLRRIPPEKPLSKKGNSSVGILKLMPLVLFLFLGVIFVSAGFGPRGTLTQEADRLNFVSAANNMTVYVYYNCSGQRVFNVTFPAGFTVYNTGAPCGKISNTLVSCNFDDNSFSNNGWYFFSGTNVTEHTVLELPSWLSNTTNCSVTNNISVIQVPEEEIFYSLVEYGRGRGNYFYSTRSGAAGSGHTGVGCPYVPNGTMFELNFLHKIFNIKQYYNDATGTATKAKFTCSYPNRTIVRSHLGTGISQSSSETNITYDIDQIEGSWERMGYVGMQFDPNEQYVGENLTITCRNISYYLPSQEGYVKVYAAGSSFTLQVRNPKPFIAAASTTDTIGNGTQEVLITYNITNNEVYTVDDVVIEINAPPYADFIGTRGELWGTALDQYRIEKSELSPGESELITLVARFDTSNAPSMSSVNLTKGIKLKYVTCWDLNAYNPAESLQKLYNIGSASVNMAIPTKIIGVKETINQIYNLISYINTTTITINNTVNNIYTITSVINSTTLETNTIVKQINNTVNDILNDTTLALTNTYLIINDTSYIKDLINCNETVDTPMCSQLDIINNTIVNVTNVLYEVNQTLHNITVNVTIDLSGENISVNVTPDLTNVTKIIDDIYAELNCSMNWTTEPNASICKRLDRIENNTLAINSSVMDVNNLINYFNTTVFGNVTLKDIYDSLNNITVNTSGLLEEIKRMREFDEELVFLVTDAFGLQQSARVELNKGDLGSAATRLKEANNKLDEAVLRLMKTQKEQETGVTESEKKTDFTWVFYLTGFILIVGLLIYLFSRPGRKK